MSDIKQVLPEKLPLHEEVRILESNEDGLVALEKPAGLLSHPNEDGDTPRSLLNASYDYEGEYFYWKDESGAECRAWLVNRLDSPTSGVILLALNDELNLIVKQVFATHRATKVYHALVRNAPRQLTGTWTDYLSKDLYNGSRRIKRGQQVKAKVSFQTIKKPIGGFPIALIKLNPVTGRTHQLRVQCGKHGHPIVGDRNYGHFAFNKEVVLETGEKGMMLHSSETSLTYAYKGQVRNFRARSELPKRFSTVFDFRPGMKRGTHRNEGAASEKDPILKGRRFKQG